jgi:hypothetical protein
MKTKSTYSSQNAFLLILVFILFFGMLYSLGSFLHEDKKIQDAIEKIRRQNEINLQKIEAKQRRKAYLNTDERKDKEAKIQMGKIQQGEQVLIFIEENITPYEVVPNQPQKNSQLANLKNWQKWIWILFQK